MFLDYLSEFLDCRSTLLASRFQNIMGIIIPSINFIWVCLLWVRIFLVRFLDFVHWAENLLQVLVPLLFLELLVVLVHILLYIYHFTKLVLKIILQLTNFRILVKNDVAYEHLGVWDLLFVWWFWSWLHLIHILNKWGKLWWVMFHTD